MNKNCISRVLLLTLFVRVRRSNGKVRPVVVEGKGRNACRIPVELAQPFLVGAVPNIHFTVATPACKRAVLWIERNCIDWVDRVLPVWTVALISVAFEGVLPLLRIQRRIHPLYRHSAVNRREHVTIASRGKCNAPCLKF